MSRRRISGALPATSPYVASTRRQSAASAKESELADKARRRARQGTSYSESVCIALQDVLQVALGAVHCHASDVSCAELQYRLLGAKRYWYRYVKQDKTGKRWEARCYQVSARRSTLEQLQRVTWHSVTRLSSEDVTLQSLGQFESEKAATQAYDAAVKVRDASNPIAAARTEPLKQDLTTIFQVEIVSDRFARRDQRERLEIVYELLLNAFAYKEEHSRSLVCSSHRVRGFEYVGEQVAALPQWRYLSFVVIVCAKTQIQWKSTRQGHDASDTERFGLSHLKNDRALNLDSSILPVSRGLAELVSLNQEEIQARNKSVLPHFYHGLPEELKRMIAEEHAKSDLTVGRIDGTHQKLMKNTETTFVPKYLKRRREYVLAATRIQRMHRRNAQTKSVRRIIRRHRAALAVQRVFRGHKGRVFAAAYMTVMTYASIIIQSVFRSFVSRRETRRWRWQMEHAALDIERVYRGFRDRTYVRWVRKMDASAIAIERVARGFVARQRIWRIKRARYKRVVVIPAARQIQRIWRGYQGRRISREKKMIHRKLYVLDPAAIKIERILRGFLARRLARRFRVAWDSACVIQKHWKSHRYYQKWMQLMEWRRREKMATKIGAIGRGYVARQYYKREKRRQYLLFVIQPAAVNIQRVFRGYIVRKALEDVRDRVEAAITLQHMWRNRSRIKTIQYRLGGFRIALRNSHAATIQYGYRCYRARQELAYLKMASRARHGRAAVAIQSAWRAHCSRVQLKEFRFCSRIERKAQALTNWKESRENIEFDMVDARTDLKRLVKYKAKALRRIKELKDMRIEWERRQPVVEKELSQLTQEDIDRGWGEAFLTEKHVLRFTLELSVEDILGRREQIREYESEIEDLRIELEDLERDLEECILSESMALEGFRDMEVQHAHAMFAQERERRVRLQRVRWRVRNVRMNVILRSRDDRRLAERELMSRRQVDEIGALGFERKQLLQSKLEQAIEQVVSDRAKQNQVMMEMRRDDKVVSGFDEAIQGMSKITNQYSYEYRMPKLDVRGMDDSPMCDSCGRITCDCHELAEQAKRVSQKIAPSNLQLDGRAFASRSGKRGTRGTNYGHPLRRKRNYQQE